MPGPIAKRVEERRRRNVVPGETVVSRVGAVAMPPLPSRPRAHALAAAWYESLAESGESEFFEPSDWAAAALVAMAISRALRPGATASMMSTAWAMMDDMLTTETARRKARLQVQRVPVIEDDSRPTAIDEYRKALGG